MNLKLLSVLTVLISIITPSTYSIGLELDRHTASVLVAIFTSMTVVTGDLSSRIEDVYSKLDNSLANAKSIQEKNAYISAIITKMKQFSRDDHSNVL